MKKVIYIIFSVLIVVSLGLVGWYGYIYFKAPKKVVSQTYKVGDQTILKADGSKETKTFIDVNVYDNVFEIKFNYMLDETRTAFYSQGLQFILKDDKDNFNLDGKYTKVLKSKKITGSSEYTGFATFIQTDTYYQIWGGKKFNNVNVLNYMSSDDYSTTLISTNPIDNDTFFKIQLGDELYGMKFKGEDVDYKDRYYIGSNKYMEDVKSYLFASKFIYNLEYNYRSSDVNFFSSLIFDSVASLKAGTNQICTFEFGDLFDYYKYDEKTRQYSEEKVVTDIASKISSDIKSYYSINVSKNDGNMISSKQSLFNCYNGSMNYNVDYSLDDYFIGRNLVTVDVNKFDFIESEVSGSYYFTLNEDFKSFYKDFSHIVEFEIVIDLDYLDSLNIVFLGIKEDSLKGFKIYSSSTTRKVGNQIVKGDINYV